MSDHIKRFKQIRDDLSNAIHDWETEEGRVSSKAVDQVAVKSIRKQLNYLRQFHNDDWIANKIGVKEKRQLKRWENGYSKPLPKHGWALKALYDQERRLHGEDV